MSFHQNAMDHADLVNALLDLEQEIQGSADRLFPGGHTKPPFDPITFDELQTLDAWLAKQDMEQDGKKVAIVRRLMGAAIALDKMRQAYGADLERLRDKWAVVGRFINDQASAGILKNSDLAGPSPKTDLEHYRISRQAQEHHLRFLKTTKTGKWGRAYAIAMEELGLASDGDKFEDSVIIKAQARVKRARKRNRFLYRHWSRKK